MSNISYKKGAIIYKAGDRMKEVGLIIQGSVIQRSQNGQLILDTGHLLGLAGCDLAVYPCDYIAREDTLISSFEYRGAADFTKTFSESNYGSVFILAALKQVQALLDNYQTIRDTTKEFYNMSVAAYRDYKFFCSKYNVAEHDLNRMEYLSAIDMKNAIPEWKEKYYEKFSAFGLSDLKELFTCKELCVGTIEMAGGFMTELIRRTDELQNHLEKNKSVLLVDKKNDLFNLMFDLEKRVSFISKDTEEIKQWMEKMSKFMLTSNLFETALLEERLKEYNNYDFAKCEEDLMDSVWDEEGQEATEDEEVQTCLRQILDYAEYELEEVETFEAKLKEFSELSDRNATDGDARTLRRWLTEEYYKCYKRCVKKALTQGGHHEIIGMFLNFGFMDVSYVGGEENAGNLLDLLDQLFACNMDNVSTFFEWLKSIYNGENEPSINDLDMDYRKFVKEGIRMGDIPADKENEYMNDNWRKVEFELDNFFCSGGKITCGHVTTFCPILGEDDMLALPQNMLVTSMKVKEAIDAIRSIDFGLFYREIMFSDKERGVPQEYLNVEVLPKVILLPNVGSKGMMWQVTAGTRNNTAARFMLPIFSLVDIKDIMIENCGRYRWEMCRKVQGARWNDITTPSLTSEYSDYLQYYRKNFELSSDAKEKLHGAIKRARNNFREVFVKDYENWIKYESNGSFRLNKVARNILFTYCPFGREIREGLKDNPMYQEQFNRFNIQTQRKVKKLTVIYSKFEEKGGQLTPEMKENMEYYNL